MAINMRIAIDARLYGPAKNKGLGRYVEQLVKNLEIIDKKNDYVILLRKDNWDECVFQSLRFKKVLADYKWYSFAEQIFLPVKLWRLKCDLVHFPHFNVPLFYRGKFVVTIHDLIMYKFPNERATTRNKFFYKIKYWLHKVIVKSAVNRAERVITVSEWTKRDVVKEFHIDPAKVVVTHLGFDIGKEIEKQRNREIKDTNDDKMTDNVLEKYGVKKPYLLYIGNAYPHKNLERLIKAFKLVEEKRQGLQLLLVGKEDYFYDELKAYSLKLKANVVFTDYVTNSELAELYKNAIAYIFPSLYEGFGLPGLEAMNYGLPVLSSNTSCLPEIYGEAVLYFNPNDVGDISEKIIKILDNEELRNNFIANGFKQIKKYSWQKCALQTLEIYAHLLC